MDKKQAITTKHDYKQEHLMSICEAPNTAKFFLGIASFSPDSQYFEVIVFWPQYMDKETEEQRG